MPFLMIKGEKIRFDEGTTIEEAVSGIGLHPDSYLYLIGSGPVPMDTVPSPDAEVRVMRVASGG